MKFRKRSRVPVSVSDLFTYHERDGALERLLPPWERQRVVERHGTIHDGDRVTLRMRTFGVPRLWCAEHSGFVRDEQFVDRASRGPVPRWQHTHRFSADGPPASFVEDSIDYRPPLGPLGDLVIRRRLPQMFAFRHRRTLQDLRRHGEFASRPTLRIAVTGATGLIGGDLVPFLTTAGHRVDRLVRAEPAPGSTDINWDPQRGAIDVARLDGVDAVVHLAGESISGRWTRARKQRIRESRVEGTRLLSEALAGLGNPPRVLITSSGINIYGDRGDDVVDEDAEPGAGFLAETCVEWEAATAAAASAGIRVVNLRTGVVLSGRGGALPRMTLPIRAGVGGVLGSGRQYVSWISIDDMVAVIYRAIQDDALRGPVNAVAPRAVTYRELTKCIGRVLRRPTVVPVPPAVISLALGEMGRELVLSSVRAVPSRLTAVGFRYDLGELEDAIRFQLGRAAIG